MSARRTKFYLDKRNGKFLGVMAGIADYTGWDLTLVRVGYVALLFATGGMAGFGFGAYFLLGWFADDKPREFDSESREEQKFWQGVRARPANSIRDVRSTFRDVDRRLADVEMYVTSGNRRLADEIDALR